MAGSSNRGAKLYHETRRDRSTPSAVHCLNALLQGPLFGESDLTAITIKLDRKEHLNLKREFNLSAYSSRHFWFDGFGFQVEVLQEALKTWDIQITPLHPRNARKSLIDFEQESALICLRDYKEDWTCVRKVDGEWYEFDCHHEAPEHVPGFYVPAYIDSLERLGWTVYLVRGKLLETSTKPAGQARSGNDGTRSPPEDGAKGIGTVGARDAM
ncbi:ataxin-3 homolog [Eucalyptus grandis]|uniref:ataxin-3 homolog n=1 Tax=Eucalyptus grandis TaxID=71139 RepID=UPI00192F084A|nr:ataxin-3 homolog [Eucalyptus grandis]